MKTAETCDIILAMMKKAVLQSDVINIDETPVGNAATALKHIGKLYKIEKTARPDQLSPREIYEKRQTRQRVPGPARLFTA